MQIEKLNLEHNLIVDLKPLVDNPGLGNETLCTSREGSDSMKIAS